MLEVVLNAGLVLWLLATAAMWMVCAWLFMDELPVAGVIVGALATLSTATLMTIR